MHIIAKIGELFFSDHGDHRILKPSLTKLQTFPQVFLLHAKYTCKSAVKCAMLYITEVLEMTIFILDQSSPSLSWKLGNFVRCFCEENKKIYIYVIFKKDCLFLNYQGIK